MRKHFLLVMMCACLLVGCGNEKEITNTPEATQTTDVTSTPEESKEPEKPAAPKMEDTIFANKVEVEGSDVVYELTEVNMEEVSQSNLYRYGNDLLMSYNYFDMSTGESFIYVDLVGIETGEVLGRAKFANLLDLQIQVTEEHIYAKDSENKKTFVLNDKLEIVKEYSFEEDEFYYFDKEGENVIIFKSNEGIVVRNLETAAEELIFNEGKNITQFGAVGSNIGFTYVDADTKKKHAAYVDLNDFKIVKSDIKYAMWNTYYSNSTWLACINDPQLRYLIADESSQMMFDADIFATVSLCNETANIMSMRSDYETYTLKATLHNKEGKFISGFEAKDSMYFTGETPIWYEEYQGYVFVAITETGCDKLMFWDVSEKVEGDDLSFYSVEDFRKVEDGSAVSADYYKRAKEIGDKYGVQILIADQCATEYDMYTTNQNTDENDIKTALDYLEKSFAAYPEGFFEQFKTGEYSSVQINLVGEMSLKDGNIVPIGFVECRNGMFVMGLDVRPYELVTQTTEQIFYHEVSHMIEEKLGRESSYVDNGFSDEKWESFNTEGFVYTEYTEDGISMYGEYYDCFVDEYGTTNHKEDRARIMEYAAYGLWKEMEEYPAVVDKYNYYCDSIRKGFDTTGWPEKTFWEDTDWRN